MSKLQSDRDLLRKLLMVDDADPCEAAQFAAEVGACADPVDEPSVVTLPVHFTKAGDPGDEQPDITKSKYFPKNSTGGHQWQMLPKIRNVHREMCVLCVLCGHRIDIYEVRSAQAARKEVIRMAAEMPECPGPTPGVDWGAQDAEPTPRPVVKARVLPPLVPLTFSNPLCSEDIPGYSPPTIQLPPSRPCYVCTADTGVTREGVPLCVGCR